MSESVLQRPRRLVKTKSWSPNMHREAVWLERKRESYRSRCTKSFTCHDVDELRGCFELGFVLDSPDLDPKLSATFPALEFYRAVTNYSDRSLSRSSSSATLNSDSDLDMSSEEAPFSKFFDVDDPKSMKTRLRQWAQAVACKVQHSPRENVHGHD